MQGIIIKGIAGFYYVHEAATGVWECKAKGSFRRQGLRPLVGDHVRFAALDEMQRLGNIEELLPRKKELIRPASANVDRALVIFAAAQPEPSLGLLDRFLCMMAYQDIPVLLCFNKRDLADEERCRRLKDIYGAYPLFFTCARTGEGVGALKEKLTGLTVVAGPSGVGKSSLINRLQDGVHMQTGAVSEKLKRGRHTTRHAEILPVSDGVYIMDTPGFSALTLSGFSEKELWTCFPEFVPYEPQCRFIGCSHVNEPDCGVRAALSQGKLPAERYESYVQIYEEMKRTCKY